MTPPAPMPAPPSMPALAPRTAPPSMPALAPRTAPASMAAPAPRTATGRTVTRRPMTAADPSAAVGRQCGRCGAVGTHYLTCPDLRLPSGYRVSEPPWAPAHSTS
jgi:hypothetical protein